MSGNLSVGSNDIEFSTGDISSQEDLSFTINREAKLVIRQNGFDACHTKLINIALPTLAADAASKDYVDSEILTFVGSFLPLTGSLSLPCPRGGVKSPTRPLFSLPFRNRLELKDAPL